VSPPPSGRALRPLPAWHRWLPRVYYGWAVAVGTSLVASVVVGVGFYGIAVFLDALCSEHGWSRPAVSFATTLYFVTSGIAGSAIGRAVDRQGPRVWIGAGGAVMALAVFAVGRVEEPWQLALVYPLLAIGFAMAGPIPTGTLISHWFARRRARAMSVSQTGVSVGGILLVPLATAVILEAGFEAATRGLSLLLIAVVVPLAIFVLRDDPREHGLEPDGDGAQPEARFQGVEACDDRLWSARDALRTRTFWLLVTAFGCILFCQVDVPMHQPSLLRLRLDAGTAALAVSTTASGSLIARLVVGSFADRVSKRRLGIGLIGMQATALLGFAFAESAPTLFAASLVFGFTIGNLFMLQMLLVGELFGLRSFGTVLGLPQLLTQTLSGLGPLALGLLHAAFGGYPAGLVVLVGVALVAAVALSRVRAPAARDQRITAS
jgi:sugar phosphate permease